MPGVLAPVSYEPIAAVRMSGSQAATPAALRTPEDASQTYKIGVPVKLVSGYLQECVYSAADITYGISYEPAHNLTVAGSPTQQSEGTPQNQPSAIITAVGAWPTDGNCGVYQANGQNIFSIALKAGQVFIESLLASGTLYGLVKDSASGFWYLDITDTSGNNAVAVLQGVDPSCPNTAAGGSRVFFQFAASLRYFS